MKLFDAVLFSANNAEMAYQHCKQTPEDIRLHRRSPFSWRRFSMTHDRFPECSVMICPNEYGSASLIDPKAQFNWEPIADGVYGGTLTEAGVAALVSNAAADIRDTDAINKNMYTDAASVSAVNEQEYVQRVLTATKNYCQAFAILSGVKMDAETSLEVMVIVTQLSTVKVQKTLTEFIRENVEVPTAQAAVSTTPDKKTWQEFEQAAADVLASIAQKSKTRKI